MSTMLKTAAMTLLSKTLQTFLSKYLSDVDVEGVAMPSLMDVDGQSGWGVRLSNVRLREGAELMNLPGKRKLKKPRPKQSHPDGDEAVVAQGNDENNRQDPNKASPPDDLEKVKELVSRTIAREVGGLPVTIEEDFLDRKTLQTDQDSDGDSPLSSRPSSPDMICSVSDRNGMLGCLSRGTKVASRKASEVIDVDTPTSPLSRGLSPEELAALLKTKVDLDLHEMEPLKERPSVTMEGGSETKGTEKDQESEDFIIVEQDMTLRLGTGGRIGTLDVRLVGKELHVSVEDAFLVIEACPKPDESEDNSKAKDVNKTPDSSKADAAKAKEPTKPKASTAKTAGERVVENSAIARALSAIPHLFLRDCRVRLVIREKGFANESEPQDEIGENDSVVEVGVELLSVTSGEDFLAHFRTDEEPSSSNGLDEVGHMPTSTYMDDNVDQNEYLIKRIRTGKGPDGGIWLKLLPPGRRKIENTVSGSGSRWAYQNYISAAGYCLFRCSGLDVRARMYLGKQEELSKDDWFYDDFTIDSMLYGVDYVAPGPSPSLPPLEHDVSTNSLDVPLQNRPSQAYTYQTDSNGIQSSRIKSSFHKVARGLVPSLCSGSHLPGEHCALCWEGNQKSEAAGTHPLDSAMPLPGLVFYLSLKDPLEINIDRSGLEVLGLVQSLFKKAESVESLPKVTHEEVHQGAETIRTKATSTISKLRDRWVRKDDETLSAAFPSYMQPEKIEVIGIHLTKVILRFHVMQGGRRNETGLTFRYWETTTRCVTLDLQRLSAEEKTFQDVRFEVGGLSTAEFKGVELKRLILLGLPHEETDDADSVSVTSTQRKSNSISPWPSTASALLNIPPPFETLDYESREKHALQMRYITLAQPGRGARQSRTHVNVRLGEVSIDMPFAIKTEIFDVIREASSTLFGQPKQDENASKITTEKDEDVSQAESSSSLMKYRVMIDGGNVSLYPVVNIRLPLTSFGGESSSDSGFFLETLLDNVQMEYGKCAPLTTSSQEVSLAPMATLPESVRMRILLFLKDLGPLERALGVKREDNSFLRCRAVNKGLVKVAKRMTRQKSKTLASRSSRRHDVITELLKLDEGALEDLWNTHQKSLRKHKRHTSSA